MIKSILGQNKSKKEKTINTYSYNIQAKDFNTNMKKKSSDKAYETKIKP